MNVKFLLSLVLLSCGVSAVAAVITPEEAISRAQSAQSSQLRLAPATSFSVPELVYTVEASDAQLAAYVFNRGESSMIVAADDEIVPILGYTDNGAFDPNNIPDGLAYMLQCYAEEIDMLRHGAKAPAASRAERQAIEPLIKSKWNQSSPFNQLCPNGSPSGCVMTAFAQICYYYQYPQSMTGEGTATDNVKGETLVKDLSEFGTFDYDKMQADYSVESTDESKNEVAKLMSALGYAFGATYKNGVTSASTPKGMSKLMKFGYNAGTILRPRATFAREEWEDMIYAELAQNHPVPYAGSNSAGLGHAFIVDGYDGQGLFHVNWGWGGMSDGYYMITVLDPSNHGIGGNYGSYSMKQMAGFGFYPDPTASASPDFYVTYDQPFTLSEYNGPKTEKGYKMQILNASHQMHNYSLYAEKYNFEPGLEITDVNNPDNKQELLYTDNTRSFSAPGNTNKGASTLYLNLADGEYILKPIWRNATFGGIYPVHCHLSTPQYQILTIANGNATFSDPEGEETKYPEVSDMAILNGDIVLSSRSISEGTIVNNTDEEFFGQMIGLLMDGDGNLAAESAYNYIQVVNIPAHSEAKYQMSSLFSDLDESGDYKFVWAVVDNLDAKKYTVVSNGVEVTVSNEKPETVAAVTDVVFNQEDVEYLGQTMTFYGVDKHKFSVTFTVTCEEGFFEGVIKLLPIDSESKNPVINSFATETSVFIPMGQSETITFEGDYNCLSQGHTYQLNVFGQNDFDVTQISSEYFFTVAGEYEDEIEPFYAESVVFHGSGTYDETTSTWKDIDPANFNMDLNIYCNALPESNLYMFIDVYDSADNDVELYGAVISLVAGRTTTFNINKDLSASLTPGEEYMIVPLIYNYGTGEYTYLEPYFYFTVADGSTPSDPKPDYEIASIVFNDNSVFDADTYTFTGIDAANFDMSINMQNNTGADTKPYLYISIYDYDSDDELNLMYKSAKLSSSETTTLNFKGDYSKELVPGRTYFTSVQVYSSSWKTVEPYYFFTVAENPDGIDDTSINKEIMSQEYYNMQGIRVNNPKNGVYIRLVRYADGKCSTAKVLK